MQHYAKNAFSGIIFFTFDGDEFIIFLDLQGEKTFLVSLLIK